MKLTTKEHKRASSEPGPNSSATIDFFVAPNGVVRDHWPWKPKAVGERQRASASVQARLINLASPPNGCSRDVPTAPARGKVAEFREERVLPVGSTGFEISEYHYPKGAPARCEDVFDRMMRRTKRQEGTVLPDALQVRAGRTFRDLSERMAAEGLKLSSLEAGRGGGADAEVVTSYLRDKARLDDMRSAIGTGMVMAPRRNSPASFDRGQREAILAHELIHEVCVADKDLGAVLKGRGWSGGTKNLKVLRPLLCALLQRMVGI